jgi:hypothetical protein
MTGTFVPLRRIAALSVAITLFAAPITSAQSPEAAPPVATPTNTALLSPSAFAGLVNSSTPIVAARQNEKPRPALLKQGQAITAGLTRTAAPAAAQPPRRRGLANWQKQVLFWGAVFVGLVILANLPDD